METATVLYVDDKRCVGCGTCVDVCPQGAISLHDGKASIRQDLCNQCEACAVACPEGAILSVTETSLVPEQSAVPATAQGPRSGVGTITATVAPALGAALLFLGREVVPRVADYMLDAFDRRKTQQPGDRLQRSQGSNDSQAASGSGRRRRRRHRGA
jgi:Fe-S-cluster-containing hydrogenase component 2